MGLHRPPLEPLQFSFKRPAQNAATIPKPLVLNSHSTFLDLGQHVAERVAPFPRSQHSPPPPSLPLRARELAAIIVISRFIWNWIFYNKQTYCRMRGWCLSVSEGPLMPLKHYIRMVPRGLRGAFNWASLCPEAWDMKEIMIF